MVSQFTGSWNQRNYYPVSIFDTSLVGIVAAMLCPLKKKLEDMTTELKGTEQKNIKKPKQNR
jgi:hypothetical protein